MVKEIVAATEQPETEIDRLKRELAHLTSSGIIEIAVRNPNVAEYMRHWEERAEKAEAENARLREALDHVNGSVTVGTILYERQVGDLNGWVKRLSARIEAALTPATGA